MLLDRRAVLLSGLSFFNATVAPYSRIVPTYKSTLLRQQDLQTFKSPSDPQLILLPPGVFDCDGLILDSGMSLIGAGQERTILRSTTGVGRPVLTNSDRTGGNHNIEVRGLSIDGNASEQVRSTNGVEMDNVSDSRFDIEVFNCFGTGFLLSAGQRNVFGNSMYCHGNGRRGAGYGLYIFGSSNNVVRGGRFDNNCIGVAVEASRTGGFARNNQVIDVRCIGNRADFNQSGAGIHFEQSEGGVCDGIIVNSLCSASTGVGINNTACRLRIEGGQCKGNREAGVVTVAAPGIDYVGITCEGNALGPSNGYRCEMRFDDSGIAIATWGRVAACRLRGSAPDGGMKSMSARSAINFVGNSVIGYRFPYNLQGQADKVS